MAKHQAPPTFADTLRQWRDDLRHKERAALLGVELDTFRGWLYGRHTPTKALREVIEQRMAANTISER